MPDGLQAASGPEAGVSLNRQERPSATAFVTNIEFGTALRDGLLEWLPDLEVRRGGIRAAINVLREVASPRFLIVDVEEEELPLPALRELSTVVTPETDVLVVGNACRRSEDRTTHDLALYREITRGLGAAEYLPEPLTPGLVRRYFGPIISGDQHDTTGGGGRLITITGARGGVGASVIAASLAWYCGDARRHTVLLDADLTRGSASLLLDTDPGDGLRLALREPGRIDSLLAERAARPVAERLHVLATGQPDDTLQGYAPRAGEQLLAALRQRYGFIVADTPWNADPFCRELFIAAHHRVLVLTPTLLSVRDAIRLRAIVGAEGTQPPTTLVLNRATMQGALKLSQVEDALGHPVQVTIPDLPRQIATFVSLGEPATVASFRNGIAKIGAQIGIARQSEPRTQNHGRWRLFRRRS